MFYNQGAEVVFRKYVAEIADVCGSAGKWRVQVESNRNSGRRVERRMERKLGHEQGMCRLSATGGTRNQIEQTRCRTFDGATDAILVNTQYDCFFAANLNDNARNERASGAS